MKPQNQRAYYQLRAALQTMDWVSLNDTSKRIHASFALGKASGYLPIGRARDYAYDAMRALADFDDLTAVTVISKALEELS